MDKKDVDLALAPSSPAQMPTGRGPGEACPDQRGVGVIALGNCAAPGPPRVFGMELIKHTTKPPMIQGQ